jgi:hypothetical protein
MSDDLKKWLPWVAAGVLVLIFAVVVIANLGGDDLVAADSTTTSIESTTTIVETTTTSIPETTTTTVPETTTTTAPVDTTTTDAPPETTTTTAAPATVSFTEHGIFAGEEWIYFGFDDEDTIAAVTAVLGAPTIDSGWVDEPLCPPPVVRTVRWNDLWLLFTKADTDFWTAGVPHFFTYQYSGPTPALYTTEGIGLGSSLEALEDAYGGPDLVIEDSPFDPDDGFWSYKLASWTGMWGFSSGQTSSDTVTAINGGRGCGE